jgi:pantoate--beta-alanine ligase
MTASALEPDGGDHGPDRVDDRSDGVDDLMVFDDPVAMRSWSDEQHRCGHRIGFVPTMGALHDGHLTLIEVAASRCDRVVVSVFVNPLQFDRPDDFDAYPRDVGQDLSRCRSLGVHVAYVPTAAAMYPDGFDTHVEPGRLADRLEGVHRPGHFRGVATVVTKLFGAVRPDVAVFGEKDAQQLAIVRRLAIDLELGTEVVGVPTVREHDGLARSSRNERLDPPSRRAARCVPAALAAVGRLVEDDPRVTVADIEATAHAVLGAEPLARPEYATVVDRRTFAPAGHLDEHSLLVLAVWIGDVRLIDNMTVLEHDASLRRGG